MMRMRVPPLEWVRVFEAAARHGSFATAGKELSLTASAVSRTVKELEGYLGTRLFERHPCGITLTERASAFAQTVRPALTEIALASDALYREARHTVAWSSNDHGIRKSVGARDTHADAGRLPDHDYVRASGTNDLRRLDP